VFKQADRQVTWPALVKVVTEWHTNTQMAFDDAKLESDQQKSIKEWIFKAPLPEEVHLDTLKKTKVNQQYAGCGQWLLDKDEFKHWFQSQPGKEVLWLRGTGEYICLGHAGFTY